MKAFLLISCALSGVAIAESAIPSAFARERYQETFSASPFALATPDVKSTEEVKDSPLNNLVVTGMGKLDDGRDFVIVQRVGEEGSMRFEGLGKNKEGLAVKQVKWGEKWGQSTVMMAYENEQKEIRFKENSSPAVAAPPGPGAQMQRGLSPAGNQPPPIIPSGVNGGGRPGVPKQGITTTGIPRPGGATQVPRPGSGAQLQPNSNFRSGQGGSNGNVPTPTNGGAPRQRIRSINNR